MLRSVATKTANWSHALVANPLKRPSCLLVHQQRCWYRGDSGEATYNLSAKEEELIQVAKPRSEEIHKRHVQLPNMKDVPKASLGDHAEEGDELELAVRKKRLIYRSKQRGWLEVDLLLGTWASQNVLHLSSEELDEFEAFVNMETIDIYNIITLRLDVPDELKASKGGEGNGRGDDSTTVDMSVDMSVAERIQAWARNSPLGKADPEKYKEVKTDNNLI